MKPKLPKVGVAPLTCVMVAASLPLTDVLSTALMIAWSLAVTVTPPDGGQAATRPCVPGADRVEVVLPGAQAAPVRVLDLALVIDTCHDAVPSGQQL